MNAVRLRFRIEAEGVVHPVLLVVAVKLINGAIETITNTHYIESKLHYYLDYYDEDFRLKNNHLISIVNFMLVEGGTQ